MFARNGDGLPGSPSQPSEECTVKTAPPPSRKAPRPRADALRNRERIVTAAREMFVEFGPDVPLDDVARRAGVGNATVYRNFPDRDALMREVVCSVMDRTMQAAERALTESGDAFEALESFAHAAADERISALCPMISSAFDQHHPDLDDARRRTESLVAQLMDRAKAAGQLRADVDYGDLLLGVAQLSRPPAGAGCMSADRFVHRHLQLFLDGMRAPAPSVLPGSAVTVEDLRR
ncbi:TetR family transcriptional regulator [Streptomyces sp. WAC 01420]|nr:TetR family transcriptional regulator [Streptomyces sp. WAC 01438]RSN02184.1 TetR family transcriptional regulator [Streptomyces sp. WAC 01420]